MGCGASARYAAGSGSHDKATSSSSSSTHTTSPVTSFAKTGSGDSCLSVPTVGRRLSVEAETKLFDLLDKDGSGQLDAQELSAVLLAMDRPELDEDAVNALICEVDVNGDCVVARSEFAALLNSPHPPEQDFEPHLVLHFDVNQTVLMIDSITKSSSGDMLNEVIANASWGRLSEETGSDGTKQMRWELMTSEPTLQAPSTDLKTYTQFVVQTKPKNERRSTIRSFTKPGQPGEALASHVERLEAALRLPPDVLADSTLEDLERLGLESGNHLLLRSFMHALRELKKAGRSFSVVFRTFGCDLGKIADEFNALCEDRHPLFSSCSSPKNVVRLDGKDGLPDMRMDLSSGGHGSGTFIRNPETGEVSLVWGSLEQPSPEQVTGGKAEEFYAERGVKVNIISGSVNARESLKSLLHERGSGRCIALRDYYPAWEAAGRKASAGKPLFLESRDTSVLQIFFDDHILPNDACIIDVRHADDLHASQRAPPPVGSVFGTHLIRAEPLRSILDTDYFLGAIAAAEKRWHQAWDRRRSLVEGCMDLSTLQLLQEKGKVVRTPVYLPHSKSAIVTLHTDENALDVYDAVPISTMLSRGMSMLFGAAQSLSSRSREGSRSPTPGNSPATEGLPTIPA
eukprot:TRINITY_DN124306_c0_g1_i1.p1 TRINITY_DN124306_c0_g1~~TRINITY_DN124306_c0_g1_i1.p1  ORF type:complete len:628 (+),score=119.38 TRINITY_DN124306_c0_g1_i1:66-1949(+)